MNKEISRNKIHEKALQIMYCFLIQQKNDIQINVEETIETICEKPYKDCDPFLKSILIKALKHEKETINVISTYLRKWKFNRLNLCTQAILILGYTYYYHIGNVDKPIIINIAINLSKKYCDKTEFKFVNALLDNCLV